MKGYIKVIASVVAGVVVAASAASPALAWDPKGKIKKHVQNQTQNGKLEDANVDAVAAKKGDTLLYVIKVTNSAAPAGQEFNDMYYTVMTDELPAGIELKSDPAKRKIVEEIGRIKPGETVVKEYLVTVTSDKDQDLIDNKACFTGDSKIKDRPQNGCDNALVKTEKPKPETPKTPDVLPSTGIGNVLLPAGVAGALGYFGNLLRLKRRNTK